MKRASTWIFVLATGLIASVSGPCLSARLIVKNSSISAVVTHSPTGASLDLTNVRSGESWLRKQPLFEWKFNDGRGVVTSLSGWTSVRLSGKVLTFRKPGIEVTTKLTLYPGESPLRVSTSYRDLAANPVLAAPCESFALRLNPKKIDDIQLLYVNKGTTRPDLLALHRVPMKAGATDTILCSGTQERDELDRVPWFCFQRRESGGAYFGWEFSGYGKFDVARNGDGIRFAGGLEPERFAKRGSVELPDWFVGLYNGTEDDGANQLHHWWMKYRFPKVADPLYPRVHYNTWTAVATRVDESNCLAHIKMAKTLGAELFHIDAGWYKGVDDWYPNPTKFPRGLVPIADAAHGAGLKFGLWIAPNHASPRLYALHPDWTVAERVDDSREFRATLTSDIFSGAAMCWGNKPFETYITNELERVVRDYKLDYLEHDQGIIMDCHRDTVHTHHLGGGAYEIVRGYYRSFDALRKKFPDLLLEDCMNGGHIIDYGVMQRFQLVSLTDRYVPEDNRRAIWGATFPMPPSYCEMYMKEVSNVPPHYQFRSFMMGLWSLSADTTKWSPEKVAACRRDIAAYKRIRPIIRDGNVYHVLPRPDGKNWDGMQYYHPSMGKGVLFVFRPDSSEPSHTIKLRGLDAKATYSVSLEDSPSKLNMTGSQLMSKGITVSLPEKFGSEIVYLAKNGRTP